MDSKPIHQVAITENSKIIPDKPLVTIITPVLNRVDYIKECIQSVLNQTYPYIEHLFVDGVSTDGTLEILAGYQAKYPDRIRFISEKDKGVCDAWNKGFALAKGQIFGWLGSDDTYCSDAIETVVRFFKENPGAPLVFGDCNTMDEKGTLISRVHAEDFELKKAITTSCCMYAPSVFYRRAVVNSLGPLDLTTPFPEFDYYLRAGKIFKFSRIENALGNFRMHKGSITGGQDALYMYARGNYLVAKRHGAALFSPRGRNYILASITRPVRPLIVYVYNSKRLKSIVAPIYYLIIGKQGKADYYNNNSSSQKRT